MFRFEDSRILSYSRSRWCPFWIELLVWHARRFSLSRLHLEGAHSTWPLEAGNISGTTFGAFHSMIRSKSRQTQNCSSFPHPTSRKV